MKLYKTRIQKLTQADGTIKYFAQYKTFFGWNKFSSFEDDVTVRLVFKAYVMDTTNCIDYGKSEKAAKKLIDCYVAHVNEYNSEKKNSKIVRTEYEDYP